MDSPGLTAQQGSPATCSRAGQEEGQNRESFQTPGPFTGLCLKCPPNPEPSFSAVTALELALPERLVQTTYGRGHVARTRWGWCGSDTIHVLPGTHRPECGPCRPCSLGKVWPRVKAAPGPWPPGWPGRAGLGSRGEATHQVDAVGVHAAQGPPAQVCVIVLGVGLHAAGVVAQGAAEGEQGLSLGLPAWL